MIEVPRGKVCLIYGKKGSGKSLFLARMCKRALKEKRYVFSNSDEVGALPLPDQYWLYQYPPGSVLIIDEVSTIHRSRDFKSFPKECGTWYKMVRKLRINVYLTSQVDDVDKTIRSLADYVLVLGATGSPLQTGTWYVTTLLVAAKIDEDGVAVGAAEIAMGLTVYGGILKRLYFQWGPLYYKLTDTYRLFGEYRLIQDVLDLPSWPDPLPPLSSRALRKLKAAVMLVMDAAKLLRRGMLPTPDALRRWYLLRLSELLKSHSLLNNNKESFDLLQPYPFPGD